MPALDVGSDLIKCQQYVKQFFFKMSDSIPAQYLKYLFLLNVNTCN